MNFPKKHSFSCHVSIKAVSFAAHLNLCKMFDSWLIVQELWSNKFVFTSVRQLWFILKSTESKYLKLNNLNYYQHLKLSCTKIIHIYNILIPKKRGIGRSCWIECKFITVFWSPRALLLLWTRDSFMISWMRLSFFYNLISLH